ncbi:MAG: hypothetical protein R3B92_01435 [Patescibacteria group bacterium]|uniref:Uncharacterized protein n=1 Tax=candidate division WWE3 bacterium TaxID=2053526 RepID=A0A955J1Q1_UNCKA|nr:hypothetical protein [candidate division WWE3 bacterium]
MQGIGEILKSKEIKRDTRNSHEHQAFGNRLAEELNDTKHRALYIRLAKTQERNILEQARDFVISQEHVTKKGPLFMWKYKQIKDAKKTKEKATR